jgi:EAL domain-containing protein (putative c-di-GMP-specific phosphodiesterase class I)
VQYEYLANQGCHAFQGYLFGKPLPLAAFEAAIRERTASQALQ